MDLIPEKVQEGRLIAALSLEQRVLANGVLPNSKLMERVSLVKGIVTGLLEQGKWNEAIRLVYKEGSPARALFDGDWEGLRTEILESVQKPQRERYIGDDVDELLMKHNEAELLYDIASRLPLEEKEFAEILAMVEPQLPAERMKEGYNTLAVKAGKQHNFVQAYNYYQKAENTAAVGTLYQTLMKKTMLRELSAPHPEVRDLELLLTIAGETNTAHNSRAAQAVYAVLKKPESLRFSRDIPPSLMRMVCEHKISLSTSQDDLLKDALVSQLSFYHLKEWKPGDSELNLRWARHHTKSSSKDAYGIFKSWKYSGPEVNIAVQQGLKNREEKHDHHQGLAPAEIDEPHLRQVYDSFSLELKVSIASHLKDSSLLQDLSRQYSVQKKEGSIATAYRLWIYGHGDQQDSYIEGLRESMIKKELKDERPSASLFLPEDKAGNRRWYLHMVERDPVVAYDVAKRIYDPALLSEVRILMVRESPLGALKKFKGYREEDKDTVGINLALDALAKEYGVSRRKIDEYLALKK